MEDRVIISNDPTDSLLNIPVRSQVNRKMHRNIKELCKKFGIKESDVLRIALNYFFEDCYNEGTNIYLLFNINKSSHNGNTTTKEEFFL